MYKATVHPWNVEDILQKISRVTVCTESFSSSIVVRPETLYSPNLNIGSNHELAERQDVLQQVPVVAMNTTCTAVNLVIVSGRMAVIGKRLLRGSCGENLYGFPLREKQETESESHVERRHSPQSSYHRGVLAKNLPYSLSFSRSSRIRPHCRLSSFTSRNLNISLKSLA